MYRKPVVVKDITEISQLLEAAQGVRDAANNVIDESDSDTEHNKNTESKKKTKENHEIFKEINSLQ